ncbi:MAG: hypothetical protein V2A54_07135, partial [Bacteroidota bacterium]
LRFGSRENTTKQPYLIISYTLPSVPLTSLLASSCNQSDMPFNALLETSSVYKADSYQYKITNVNTGHTEYVTKNINHFFMNEMNAKVEKNTLYSFRSRASINGVWGNWGDSCNNVTANNQTLNACQDEEISIQFQNVTSGVPIVVSVNIIGAHALNNADISGTSVTVDTINPHNPTYTFTAPATNFTLLYHIKPNCEVFSANTENIYTTASISINGATPFIVLDSFEISTPWIVFNDSMSINLTATAFLHEKVARTFMYINTGESFTGDFMFTDTLATNPPQAMMKFAGIKAEGIKITGIQPPTVSDSKVSITISLQNFMANDTIIITDTVERTGCYNDNNKTHFFASYGCSGDALCAQVPSQYFTTTLNEDPLDKPILQYELLTTGYNTCWSLPKERQIKITNTGQGTADSTMITVYQNGDSWTPYEHNISEINPASLYVFKDPACTIPVVTHSTTYPSLSSSTTIFYAVEPLTTGNSFYIKYNEIIHCDSLLQSDLFFNQKTNLHLEGFPRVRLMHLCETTDEVLCDANKFCEQYGKHESSLGQTLNNYTGTMNGGDSVWLDVVSTTPLLLASTSGTSQTGFINEMKRAKLEVKIKLEKGIGIVEDSLYLISRINGLPAKLYPTGRIIDLGSATPGYGDTLTYYFTLADSFYTATTNPDYAWRYTPTNIYNEFFVNNSFKVHFQVEAFCNSSLNGTPSQIKQEFYFIADSTCADCRIPLSMVKDSIKVHCPGCVTPGWNLNYFDITRTNFGYADDNNNNFPDAIPLTAANPLLAQTKHAMMGDTLEFTIKGQLSDGGNIFDTTGAPVFVGFSYFGFDFNYAQLEFTGAATLQMMAVADTVRGKIKDASGNEYPFKIPPTAVKLLPEGYAVSLNKDTINQYKT